MKRPRLSILALMTAIVLIALGFAALRNPTVLGASLTFTATVAFLATAIVAAIARRGRARVTWAGVAVFGWAYLLMSFGPFKNGNGVDCPPFPTQALVEVLANARAQADARHFQRTGMFLSVESEPLPESFLGPMMPVPAIGATMLPSPPVMPPPELYRPPDPVGPSADGSGNLARPASPPVLPAPILPIAPPPTVTNLKDFRRIGHSLGAIAFGFLGGLIGFLIAGRDRPSDGGPIPS
jgi:hypothetical protein